MTAVVTARACEAVGEDAAFQIFAKGFLHIGGRGVVVTLAFELSGAGQLQLGLKVFGHRAVQQGALGVAGVVGFGGSSNHGTIFVYYAKESQQKHP